MKITLLKTIKMPISGIQFSNKIVSVEVEYQKKGFDIIKAKDEINQMLNVLENDDPEWITPSKRGDNT